MLYTISLTAFLIVLGGFADDSETSSASPMSAHAAYTIQFADDMLPIDSGTGDYKGLEFGLYNSGDPVVSAVDGSIVAICVGMSNSNAECDAYMEEYSAHPDVSPDVHFVNCALAGNAIEQWNTEDFLWNDCRAEVESSGFSADQVRVIWHKAALKDPVHSFYPEANSAYYQFIDELDTFSDRVSQFFPSVQAVYTTSRSYGGYTTRVSRGEPIAYEHGHALNSWLESVGGLRNGVWHGWGPYIWAPDCDTGILNGSGICYVRDDYAGDGVHPGAGVRSKVAAMLHETLMQQNWYSAVSTGSELERPESGSEIAAFPNPVSSTASIALSLARSANVTFYVFDVLGRRVASKPLGFRTAGRHDLELDMSNLAPGMYVGRTDDPEMGRSSVVLIKL